MKRSSLNRRTPLRPGGPLARRTPLRAALVDAGTIAARVSVRATVRARSRGLCEAGVPLVCGGSGEHFHHRKRRSQGGADDAVNLLHVCHACHGWIHEHPDASYAARLLVRSWDTPTSLEAP